MIHQLLVVLSLAVLLAGGIDLIKTREDQEPPVVTPARCPSPGSGQRYVRLAALPQAQAWAQCTVPELGSRFRVVFSLHPYGFSSDGKHAIVHVEVTGPNGERYEGVPRPSGPGPVYGLLKQFPTTIMACSGSGSIESATLSVLDASVEPPSIVVPLLFLVLGGLAAYLLTAGPDEEDKPPDPAPGSGWAPFHRVEPSMVEATGYLVVTVMILVPMVAPRLFRIGGPHLYDSVLLTLIFGAAAWLAGTVTWRKSTNAAWLCPEGIMFPAEPLARRSLPWSDIGTVRRDKSDPGRESAYDLIFGTRERRSFRIELGSGPEADRAAVSLAGILTPVLLPGLRDRVTRSETLDFGSLRLTHLSVSWEDEKGWRVVEFLDLQEIRIAGGIMAFRLIAAEWDAFTCHYQELPNGFLLPALLAALIGKTGSRCELSWLKKRLAGRDGWLSPAGEAGGLAAGADPEGLARRWLEEGLAAMAGGRAGEALTPLQRAASMFESLGHKEVLAESAALQAVGCLLLDRADVDAAGSYLDRVVTLLSTPGRGTDDELARALSNRGVVHWQAHRQTDAGEDAGRAVAIYRGLESADPVHLIRALNNLAGFEAQTGNVTAVGELVEQALTAAEGAAAAAGGAVDVVDLGWLVRNASSTLEGARDAAARCDLYVRATELFRVASGPDSLAVAQGLFSLGRLRHERGETTTARACFEEALGLYEKRLGEHHRRTGECLDWLGEISWRAGEVDQARAAWELALPILKACPPRSGPGPGGGDRLKVLLDRLGQPAGRADAPFPSGGSAARAPTGVEPGTGADGEPRVPLFDEPGRWRMLTSPLPPGRGDAAAARHR